jgi:hypothetical protein
MLNKSKSPAVVFKNAKAPNIPKVYELEAAELTSDEIASLAAHMYSPVRGSSPSPFAETIDFYDYTDSSGQEYKFSLQKREDNLYDITIRILQTNLTEASIWRGNSKNIVHAASIPDELKNYINKFIKNITFL